jgi:integrase
MRAIYAREKDPSGNWSNYFNVLAHGRRNGHLRGPFKINIQVTVGGKKKAKWETLRDANGVPASDVETAKKLADKYDKIQDAIASGVDIPETNDGSMKVEAAVEQYLRLKRNKRPKTVAQYKTALVGSELQRSRGLLNFIPGNMTVKQLATPEMLDQVLEGFEKQGYDKKTIHTRMGVVFSLLKMESVSKQTGVMFPSKMVSIAKPVASRPRAYEDEIDSLWSKMDDDEHLIFTFFLVTGCREQEVTYATWDDVDLENKIYRVTGDGKEDVDFVPKNHEERKVWLSSEVCELLKARKKSGTAHERWLFPTKHRLPDGHFLRKFKKIALDAGLNCKRCKSTTKVGPRYAKQTVEVNCETHPVCEKHYLHRLRKTAATRWLRAGYDLETIRKWLGHKSLSVTQLYLDDETRTSEDQHAKFDRAVKVSRN